MFARNLLLVQILLIIPASFCFNFKLSRRKSAVNIDWDSESNEPDMMDWDKHPCKRTCVDGAPPMACYYAFKVESYHTMSKACYGCPFNMTDCSRRHCIPADGVGRPLQVVNRQMPGPAIEVCQGDILTVDVINKMVEAGTSIHWHGQVNRGNPHMDGVPYVTQCPIPPGTTFRYQIVAANYGTHFWHSHSGLQRGDGVVGPLIVRQPTVKNVHRDLYDDDENTIMIMDWYHKAALDKMLENFHSIDDNIVHNILINGKGRFKPLVDKNAKTRNMSLATFNVNEGSRYRFRLINADLLDCPIEVSIDNHTMTVVSTDGNDVQPQEAESLMLFSGERYDIIVSMTQAIDNYWIRFRGLMDCDKRYGSNYQLAILRYKGAAETDPTPATSWAREPNKNTEALQVNTLNRGEEDHRSIPVSRLRSVAPNDVSLTRTPDQKLYVSFDFHNKDHYDYNRKDLYPFAAVHKTPTTQFDYISMKLPSFPLLTQRESIKPEKFCNASTISPKCVKEFCECTHVLQIKLGSVVEMILVDKSTPWEANHPIHMHGYNFRIVASERIATSVTLEEVQRREAEGLIKRNLDHPPIKDTVVVPDGGYSVIRFHANNPGYWLFHCHLEYHFHLGMALVLKVGEHEEFPPVPEGFPKCGDYKPPRTMNIPQAASLWQYKIKN